MKFDKLIYMTTKIDPYIGGLLQSLDIRSYSNVPFLAGICYNGKKNMFELFVNYEEYDKMSFENQLGVFFHEMLHIMNKHVYFKCDYLFTDKKRLNVAMDLVVNQCIEKQLKNKLTEENNLITDVKKKLIIPTLPDNVMRPELFGVPENLTTIEYYKLLEKNKKYKEMMEKQSGKDGEGEGRFDNHEFNEEANPTPEQMKALEDLLQRAYKKSGNGYSKTGINVKDLLKEINDKIKQLDCKSILRNAIKKSLPSIHREHTWKRQNKRYGMLAPGNKNSNKPSLDFYIDCSGSISHEQANEFITFVKEFQKITGDKCHLLLFHTSLFFKTKFKKNQKFDPSWIQSGGTDLTEVIQSIKKRGSDLSVIFTDGDYSDVDYKGKIGPTLFVVRDDCNLEHPLKRFGKTYVYK